MPKFNILRPSWQVADYLREELMRGTWIGTMPGAPMLATILGVDRKTVDAALRHLETEGLLVAQGAGRARRIQLPAGNKLTRRMRVAILLYEESDRERDYIVHLQHLLTAKGHDTIFAKASLQKLGMNVQRVARLVTKTEADAWVVVAGSREVLELFPEQSTPVLALFGRVRSLRIACAAFDKVPAYTAATRELIRLGHHSIVLLARAQRRLPQPGAIEQAFLDELAANGLSTSSYNLPDWEETIEGFHARLDALFRVSPPTVMIVQEVSLFIAAQQFLARRRLRVPEEVSLICSDQDAAFEWCQPSISHIRWDSASLVRRIVRWVSNVSRGAQDTHQFFAPTEFVSGGTIGPVRKS
jgi:DNA-binding LacI/PurR family transcriptional regulator